MYNLRKLVGVPFSFTFGFTIPNNVTIIGFVILGEYESKLSKIIILSLTEH